MTEVDRLFTAFKEAWERNGDADPGAFVSQVSGTDRAELEALIDGYLAWAPRQAWDERAFSQSPAANVVARLEARLLRQESLADLRNAAEIPRATLVDRLAASLGVERQRTKVADYYHDLEWGQLPAEGVSTRVWDALGAILGRTADAVRTAAQAAGPESGGAAAGQAFARAVPAAPGAPADMAALDVDAPAPADEPSDEVDELFRGRQH